MNPTIHFLPWVGEQKDTTEILCGRRTDEVRLWTTLASNVTCPECLSELALKALAAEPPVTREVLRLARAILLATASEHPMQMKKQHLHLLKTAKGRLTFCGRKGRISVYDGKSLVPWTASPQHTTCPKCLREHALEALKMPRRGPFQR